MSSRRFIRKTVFKSEAAQVQAKRCPPILAVLVALVVSSACSGQVKGPAEVTVPVGRLASIPLTVDGDEVEYTILGGDIFGGFREFSDPKAFRFQVLGYTPGTGYVVIAAQKDGKLQPLFTVAVKVTGAAPPIDPDFGAAPKSIGLSLAFGPWSNGSVTGSIATVTGTAKITGGDPIPPGPGPVPPGPTPPPVPPGPTDLPFPGDGLKVLIVEESGARKEMPSAQLAVLTSEDIRGYLRGKTKDFRVFDKDQDLTGEAKLWQDAIKRPRSRVPWLLISNGKMGYEGPLPANVADTLKLLKQYGGD